MSCLKTRCSCRVWIIHQVFQRVHDSAALTLLGSVELNIQATDVEFHCRFLPLLIFVFVRRSGSAKHFSWFDLGLKNIQLKFSFDKYFIKIISIICYIALVHVNHKNNERKSRLKTK